MLHTSVSTLEKQVKYAQHQVEVGQYYFHYKDPYKFYKILAIGFFEASEELCVIYQALYAPDLIWVRPISEWNELISMEDGSNSPRFQKVRYQEKYA